jgi:hypothetical protein
VCFELATSSKDINYLLLNLVKTLDIWLIPHLRNLTFVSQDYLFIKRDETNMLDDYSCMLHASKCFSIIF